MYYIHYSDNGLLLEQNLICTVCMSASIVPITTHYNERTKKKQEKIKQKNTHTRREILFEQPNIVTVTNTMHMLCYVNAVYITRYFVIIWDSHIMSRCEMCSEPTQFVKNIVWILQNCKFEWYSNSLKNRSNWYEFRTASKASGHFEMFSMSWF